MRTTIGKMLVQISNVYDFAYRKAGNLLNGGQKDIITNWADIARAKLEALYPQVPGDGNPVRDDIQTRFNQAHITYKSMIDAINTTGVTSFDDIFIDTINNPGEIVDAIKTEVKGIAGFAGDVAGTIGGTAADAAGLTAGKLLKSLLGTIGVPGLIVLAIGILVLIAYLTGFNPIKLLKR